MKKAPKSKQPPQKKHHRRQEGRGLAEGIVAQEPNVNKVPVMFWKFVSGD